MPDISIVAITQTALDRIRAFRADMAEPDSHGLSVGVTGLADGEYTCALSLDPLSPAGNDNVVQHEGDLLIVIAADSVEKLRGATIDWSESPLRSGFRVINPNKPPALGALPTLPMSMAPGVGAPASPPVSPRPLQGELDSELSRRVMAVLDRDVNPLIAAHGGHAELAL